jgi:hypothetical protein
MEMRSPARGAGRSGHGLEQDAPATLRFPMPRVLGQEFATEMRPGSERGVSVGELGKTRRSRDGYGRRQATGRGQNIGMAAHWLASLETRAPA